MQCVFGARETRLLACDAIRVKPHYYFAMKERSYHQSSVGRMRISDKRESSLMTKKKTCRGNVKKQYGICARIFLTTARHTRRETSFDSLFTLVQRAKVKRRRAYLYSTPRSAADYERASGGGDVGTTSGSRHSTMSAFFALPLSPSYSAPIRGMNTSCY